MGKGYDFKVGFIIFTLRGCSMSNEEFEKYALEYFKKKLVNILIKEHL
jgi:hypothetical protein